MLSAYLVNRCSPPIEVVCGTRVENSEEYNDPSNCKGAVERWAEDEVVLNPPLPGMPLNPPTENKTYYGPASVVGSRSRRNVVQAAQEDRNVDFLNPARFTKLFLHQEHGHWEKCADEEEPEKRAVLRTKRKESSRTQCTPYHTRVEVSFRKWAGETVGRLVGANIGYMLQCPVNNWNLAQRADDNANSLDYKQISRGDLAAVSKLKWSIFVFETRARLHCSKDRVLSLGRTTNPWCQWYNPSQKTKYLPGPCLPKYSRR